MPCAKEHPDLEGEVICIACFPHLYLNEESLGEQFTVLDDKANFNLDRTIDNVNNSQSTNSSDDYAKAPSSAFCRNLDRSSFCKKIAGNSDNLPPPGQRPDSDTSSDEDEEQAKPPPPPVHREKGYCDEELTAMAQAWVQTTEDPRNGSGHKKDVFDQKVWEAYKALIEPNSGWMITCASTASSFQSPISFTLERSKACCLSVGRSTP